jgi:hypothetical protein
VVFAGGAAAAKVEREFFYLFARLRVEGDLPYRHPAVVAGVWALEAGEGKAEELA